MKQLRISSLGVLVGLAVLGVGLFASSQASAASGTLMAGSGTAAIDSEVVVGIDALEVGSPGLAAWSIDITYDPSVVTLMGCDDLSISICNPAYDAPDTEADESPYTVRLVGARAIGMEGDQTLGTLTFRCDIEGTSPVAPSPHTFSDGTLPADGGSQPIDTTVVDGSIGCVTQVAGAGTVIKIGSASASVGGRAAVELQSLDVPEPGLGAWTIDVSFDPDVVHTVSCTPGATGLSVCNPDFSDDTFRVTGANIDGLPGDNSLADVTFECDAVGSSELDITIQVLADATVGQPQELEATTIDGRITCSTVAPTPTRTPGTTVLPPAGSGGGIGFDPGNPLSWVIAGLIGAGLAWLASGIASAGFAAVTSQGTSQAPQRPSAAPERPQPRAISLHLPRSMPTWRRKLDLGTPPDEIEPDRFQPPGRP